MPDTSEQLDLQNRALTRQLLEWIAEGGRSYEDAMETWRSSCPRHTIWEDALSAGLVEWDGRRRGRLSLTAEGRKALGEALA